jgi:hypothetical protein
LFEDPETKDPIWVLDVCRRGYAVITKDLNLLKRGNALMAWHRSKGRIFYIASGQATADRVCDAVVAALPEIERILTNHDGPTYASVHISGKVELIVREALPVFT